MPSRLQFPFPRYWPVGLALMAGLGLSVGLGWKLHRDAVELDKQRMAIRIKTTFDELDGRVEKTELMLRQLQDYLNTTEDVRSVLMRQWISKHNLSYNFPWLHGVAFATNRYAKAWREAFGRPLTQWEPKDFLRLWEWGTNQPVDCHLAQTYKLRKDLRWLEDYQLNDKLVDDINLDALAGGDSIKMSFRRPVMRGKDEVLIYGAYFCLPVYDPELSRIIDVSPPRSVPNERGYRQGLCQGLIIAPLDLAILEQGIWKETPRDLGVEIFAARKPSPESWLNSDGDRPRATTPDFHAYLRSTNEWKMYAKGFSVFFHTTPLFEAQSPRRMAWIALGAGVAITLLASSLVVVLLHARGRQEQMTAEVIEARDALAAAEKEREKLSHDLHDGAIQSLYAVQLGLDRTAQKMVAENGGVRNELSAARAELDAVIAEVRRFISERDRTAAAVDFSAVLRALVQRTHAGTTAEIKAHCDADASARLSDIQAVQLANIAREALSNSLRHGKPQNVEIALRSESEAVCLEISDNGVGFDPKSAASQGVGMTSMATRTKEMSGTLEVRSGPGCGTRVVIRIPTSPTDHNGPE